MSFAGHPIDAAVESSITEFTDTAVYRDLLRAARRPLAIKYVPSRWAGAHSMKWPLMISSSPLQTWGTATYVAPITHPLSSALYGRIGVVSDFDPTGWRVFDATSHSARLLYGRWAQAQPEYWDLLLSVHSTRTNHLLRNRFRQERHIDCVLFRPDQEAELHTDAGSHVWMAVSDWAWDGWTLRNDTSARLANGRFTVLVDEDFELDDHGLPVQASPRLIEPWTSAMPRNQCQGISAARHDPTLPSRIAEAYLNDSYLHLFIEP